MAKEMFVSCRSILSPATRRSLGQCTRGVVAAVLALLAVTLAAGPAEAAGTGDLDPSFDLDGLAPLTNLDAPVPGISRATALQSDGKIVVAGVSFSGEGYWGLARYNADGSLDTTFDGDGKVTHGR